MSFGYQISPLAVVDIEMIRAHREEHAGEEAAEEVEAQLLEVFSKLAKFPGLGHRRSDLTPKLYYFFSLEPYLIVYARGIDPLPILAVLHASRDVRKILRKRSGA